MPTAAAQRRRRSFAKRGSLIKRSSRQIAPSEGKAAGECEGQRVEERGIPLFTRGN